MKDQKNRYVGVLFWTLVTTVSLAIARDGIMALKANGVVFGDIGTSVLYAVNAIFKIVPATWENVIGVGSIITYTLLFKISGVYNVVLRADHHGEGGLTALMAKLRDLKAAATNNPRTMLAITALSVFLVFAFGLLFGDALITAALSILSALEGILVAIENSAGGREAALQFKPWIVWLGAGILTGLYAIQRLGTSLIGACAGPIMTLHFIVIGALGTYWVCAAPQVVHVLNPYWAIRFIASNDPFVTMTVMGSVMLAITGGEALYADLGHFGRGPIRLAWFGFVKWALLLNYWGQCAYLLSGAEVVNGNIFYSMVPTWMAWGIPLSIYSMVVLETLATIIASQALITGMFSLAAAAMHLGLLFRMRVYHTSGKHEGQIYLPFINWTMYLGTLGIMLWFQESERLEAAYGLAVSLVMLVTSLSMILIAIHDAAFRWHPVISFAFFGLSAIVDVGFIVSNCLKFQHGGWFPITVGLLAFVILYTWKWGSAQVANASKSVLTKTMEWELLLRENLKDSMLAMDAGLFGAARLVTGDRVLSGLDRCFAFLAKQPITGADSIIPVVKRVTLKKLGALPVRDLTLSLQSVNIPTVEGDRYSVFPLMGNEVLSVHAKFGFSPENPEEIRDVPRILQALYDRKIVDVPEERWMYHVVGVLVEVGRTCPWWKRPFAKLFRLMHRFEVPFYRDVNIPNERLFIHELTYEFGEMTVLRMPEFEARQMTNDRSGAAALLAEQINAERNGSIATQA